MSTAAPARPASPSPPSRRADYFAYRSPLAVAKDAIDRLFYRVGPGPRRVQFAVTNRCNLDCPMCPRLDYQVTMKDLTLARYRDALGALPATVRRVILTGWGEPLLHPDLFTMVRDAHARGLEVQFTTNALLLDAARRAEVLDCGLEFLTFSVDTVSAAPGMGHDNAPALENIEAMSRERGEGAPYLSLQVTMHRGKLDEVLGVVRWARQVGIDRVFLIRLDARHNPALLRPEEEEERSICRAAESLGSDLGVLVEHQNAVGRSWMRVAYRFIRPWLYRRDKFCAMPFETLYVDNETNVTPCCSLPKHVVGRLDDGLQAVWNGVRFQTFLKDQRTICGGCDLLTSRPRTG